MSAWMRIFVVFAGAGLLATSGACDKSPTSPPAPLELSGTWSGQLGQPGSASALRLSWDATHAGNTVSGVATMVKPAFNVQARGAMTGLLDGDRLFITFVVFSDSIPGFPTCEIAGFGNATATNNRITGALPLVYRSCGGTGLEPPGTSDLMLTR